MLLEAEKDKEKSRKEMKEERRELKTRKLQKQEKREGQKEELKMKKKTAPEPAAAVSEGKDEAEEGNEDEERMRLEGKETFLAIEGWVVGLFHSKGAQFTEEGRNSLKGGGAN